MAPVPGPGPAGGARRNGHRGRRGRGHQRQRPDRCGSSSPTTSYLTKDADRTDIAQALRAAAGGLTVFDPRVHATLLAATSGAAPATRPPDPPDGLTQREAEILSLIAQGLTNGEIAEHLFLSSHTIKTHINRIFAKTGSRDRVAAIACAQRHNMG